MRRVSLFNLGRAMSFAPLLLLPAALACAAPVGAGSGGDDQMVTLSEADNGARRTVALGDTFKLCLAAQPGTGFAWRITQGDGLSAQGDPVYSGAGIPGGTETQCFTLKATAKGEHPLVLVYDRVFEKNPPAKTVRYTITVD